MCQVIRFPGHRRKGLQLYRCTDCGHEITLIDRIKEIVWCDLKSGCGAEMRPVEMEAK